jgi:DNA-binding MarR family transcriptional regulator
LDMASPDPEKLRAFREQTLYRLLLRARRAENAEMVARIRARGYPDLQPSYPALLANLDSEGANMTVLAAKSGISRQAASQQLAEIEARGYVELRPDPADGRAVIVDRTERGRRLLHDALEVVSDLEADYAKQVGRKRFDAMKQVLAELLEGIDSAGRLDKV